MICFNCHFSLGAIHDGEHGNACSGSDQYIMAGVLETRDAANYANIYTFSSCSIQEFWKYIQTLNKYWYFICGIITLLSLSRPRKYLLKNNFFMPA